MESFYHSKFEEKFIIFFSFFHEQTSNENLIGCTTAGHSASFFHLMDIRFYAEPKPKPDEFGKSIASNELFEVFNEIFMVVNFVWVLHNSFAFGTFI